jgi:hypothetical protein
VVDELKSQTAEPLKLLLSESLAITTSYDLLTLLITAFSSLKAVSSCPVYPFKYFIDRLPRSYSMCNEDEMKSLREMQSPANNSSEVVNARTPEAFSFSMCMSVATVRTQKWV